MQTKETGKNRRQTKLSESSDDNLDSVPDLEQVLQALAVKVPQSPEVRQLQTWKQDMEWLFALGGNSRVLLVAIDPNNFTIDYANATFCRLVGLNVSDSVESGAVLTGLKIKFFDLLATDQSVTEYLSLDCAYRRHLLAKICQRYYKIDLVELGILETSALIPVKNPLNDEIKFVQMWLHSQQLQVTRRDILEDELAEFNLKLMTSGEREEWLRQSHNLIALATKLNLDNYQVEGLLLLEGFDVTEGERIRRLNHLLIDRESILQNSKLDAVDQELRLLFKAKHSLLLRFDREKLSLWITNTIEAANAQPIHYTAENLEHSPFMQSAETHQIIVISDLKRYAGSECENHLRQLGIRSLLLIPLTITVTTKNNTDTIMPIGVVALASDQPNYFNYRHYENAQELIPALTASLCQAIQQQFNSLRNIHPAVEWRFLQEARQRSWGMTPEPIVFKNVYPLYAISDIRSSSMERNQAIQADLLEQFNLALSIVDTVCENQPIGLSQQLQRDLLAKIEEIQTRVTVDMEVDAISYLQENIEVYFDYFSKCGSQTQAAIDAYRVTCNNHHRCIYKARDQYDQMIHEINGKLQETWEKWQEKMQKIIPHYCDFEATDGIDHMIYVGRSINPNFTLFHLHSLRYEQLKAVCDCGRTGFRLQTELNTTMELTHLVLVQESPINIFHNPAKEKLFEVQGTHDIRYELVKKRIDKAKDRDRNHRITQPGMLTIVYSTDEEWSEYQQYLHYLQRDGWIESAIETGTVEPLQGVNGLKFARVKILPVVD